MKSDIAIAQFYSIVWSTNPEIQEYLDGDNPWNCPINEKDIIKIDYSIGYDGDRSMRSGIFIVHRIPGQEKKGRD